MNLKIFVLATLATVCLASHGVWRSCMQCTEDSADNYFCDWGGTQGDGWHVACCQPGSKSQYCQQTKKNKCYPSFAQVGMKYYANCPKVNKALCDKNTPKLLSEKMKLEAGLEKKTFVVENLKYQNTTDKSSNPDTFETCYYIIETVQQDLYASGNIKLTFEKTGGNRLGIMSGESFSKALNTPCDYEKNECIIPFDQVIVLVVLPDKNELTNRVSFSYQLVEQSDTDWYRKLYVKHFTGEDGQKLLVIVGACIALLICIIICTICVGGYYCCCRPKIIEDPENPGRRLSLRRSSRGSSFRASMRRSMRLESFVDRSTQSFRR